VTTLTPDLLAHVASVRDGACDDNELLVLADHLAEADDEDRAELLRIQTRRWSKTCPECGGCDLEVGPCGLTDYFRPCYSCKTDREAERDLLARNPAWLSVSDPPGGIPATITRGFLTITLPHTLCWRQECPQCHTTEWHRGDGCIRCDGGPGPCDWSPHPALRAVLASPAGPWVRRVRVEGREPYHNGSGWCWFNAARASRGSIPRNAELPLPVFDGLQGWSSEKTKGVRWKPYPTAEAAADALACAVPIWARGAK